MIDKTEQFQRMEKLASKMQIKRTDGLITNQEEAFQLACLTRGYQNGNLARCYLDLLQGLSDIQEAMKNSWKY